MNRAIRTLTIFVAVGCGGASSMTPGVVTEHVGDIERVYLEEITLRAGEGRTIELTAAGQVGKETVRLLLRNEAASPERQLGCADVLLVAGAQRVPLQHAERSLVGAEIVGGTVPLADLARVVRGSSATAEWCDVELDFEPAQLERLRAFVDAAGGGS